MSEEHSKYSVFAIMTKNPVTVSEDTTVGEALELMNKHTIHHLPITRKQSTPKGDGERVIGIVAKGDVHRIISGFIGTKIETEEHRKTVNIHVKVIMKKDIHTVEPDTSIRECSQMFLDEGINSAPVVDPETKNLLGIVTSWDLLKFFNKAMGSSARVK